MSWRRWSAWCGWGLRAALVAALLTGRARVNGQQPAAGHTAQGRVVSGLDGSPIPRALVSIASRAVLTDAQGRFSFPQITESAAFFTVRKPGFSGVQENVPGYSPPTRVTNLDAAIELKLYPDAVISGQVATVAGAPLVRVPVVLRRYVFDQQGSHWVVVRTTQTNSRGEYRFREGAGKFQVATMFVAQNEESGEAVLPKVEPERSGEGERAAFEVLSGQQRRVDLHPRVSEMVEVPLRVEPEDLQRNIQFSAKTSGGTVFMVPRTYDAKAGVYRLRMPTGSFAVTGTLNGRGPQDGAVGTIQMTVTSAAGRSVDMVGMKLQSLARIPVEVTIDPVALANAPTSGQNRLLPGMNPAQLYLRLHNLEESQALGQFGGDVNLQASDGGRYEFRAAPGRYRLQMMNGGPWHVVSAGTGVATLMTEDLVVGEGAGEMTPIRIVVSNVTGLVRGTVRASGNGMVWVYLVPERAGLGGLTPVLVTNADGSGITHFNTNPPPGHYTAIALAHQATADLRDAEVLAAYQVGAKSVDVTVNGTSTVDLELASNLVVERRP
jgi:hypothetical protein